MTTPSVMIVVGSAGSGKSTVAKRIAQRYGALYLDKDSMVGELVGFGLESNGFPADVRESNAFYQEHLMPLEYRAMFRVAGENLRLGASVVLDAPFAAYLTKTNFIEDASGEHGWRGAHVIVVGVRVDEKTVRNRLIERGNPRDEWKLANWNEFWTSYGTAPCLWRGTTSVDVRNDTDADPDWRALDDARATAQ